MTMMQGLSLTGVPVSASVKKRGESWLFDCLSHVKAMHKILACLYDGLETDTEYDIDFEDTDDFTMDGDSTRLGHIFSDHCYKLVKRMTDPTNGPVEFPLSQIISVLSRCLSLSYTDVLSVPSRTDLATLLPLLHQCSMDVLSQLILCCGRDILHHSRIIIDLCLQTIASTTKMPLDNKHRTRSSTYQALVLWVKTCGWSKYLTSHRKLLIQEIIADTQADAEDGLAKKNESDESKSKNDRFSGRDKKGKRKKGHRGDSYMELETKEDDKGKKQTNEARVDLVLQAFSLSQQAVENLPFSLSQNLIAHLIKTSSTVQRLWPSKPVPYCHDGARKGLYQAVAGCLLSPLMSSGNRNDAVCHYQLTNSALDILIRACRSDHSQIQTMCSNSLAILKMSGNLKGPVIRKVLDFDDSSVEDVSQLVRENEQQSDCIEDLRQKLMNSEVENEQQSRLISSLREQITSLQNMVPSANQLPNSIPTKASSRMSPDKNILNESDADDGNEIDDNDGDDDDDEQRDELKSETEINCDARMSKLSSGQLGASNEKYAESLTSQENEKFTDRRKSDVLENSIPYIEKVSTTSTHLEKKKKVEDSKMAANSLKKRANDPDTSFGKDPKKSKLDYKEKATRGIEDMLLDFVDAPPDS